MKEVRRKVVSDRWAEFRWAGISMKTCLAEEVCNIFWQEQAGPIWVVGEDGKQKSISWIWPKEKPTQGGLSSHLKEPQLGDSKLKGGKVVGKCVP